MLEERAPRRLAHDRAGVARGLCGTRRVAATDGHRLSRRPREEGLVGEEQGEKGEPTDDTTVPPEYGEIPDKPPKATPGSDVHEPPQMPPRRHLQPDAGSG